MDANGKNANGRGWRKREWTRMEEAWSVEVVTKNIV